MDKTKRNTLLIIIFSLLLVAAMLVVYGLILPKTDNGEKNITLEIKYADKRYSYDITTNGATIADVLVEYDAALELSLVAPESVYGKFIESLKNTPQDEINGYYYTYVINGERVNFGISEQPVADGDTITISYTHTTYGEGWVELSTELVAGGDNSIAKTPYRKQNIALIIAGAASAVIALGAVVYFVVLAKKSNSAQKSE